MTSMGLGDGAHWLNPKVLTERVANEQSRLLKQGASDTRYALIADNGIPWVITDLALAEIGRLNVPIPG